MTNLKPDSVARKDNDFFFGFFISYGRSSQCHLGTFRFELITKEEAKTAVEERGYKTDRAEDFNGYLMALLNDVKEGE